MPEAWTQYIEYNWVHPEHDNWTCESRRVNDRCDYVQVKLQVPWITWPMYKEEIGWENLIKTEVIQARAFRAADDWAILLRQKADGEQFTRHAAMSCIIQMHETILHTIHTLPIEFWYLRLFYGFVADHIAKLSEVTGLELGDGVVWRAPTGQLMVNEFDGYKPRLR